MRGRTGRQERAVRVAVRVERGVVDLLHRAGGVRARGRRGDLDPVLDDGGRERHGAARRLGPVRLGVLGHLGELRGRHVRGRSADPVHREDCQGVRAGGARGGQLAGGTRVRGRRPRGCTRRTDGGLDVEHLDARAGVRGRLDRGVGGHPGGRLEGHAHLVAGREAGALGVGHRHQRAVHLDGDDRVRRGRGPGLREVVDDHDDGRARDGDLVRRRRGWARRARGTYRGPGDQRRGQERRGARAQRRRTPAPASVLVTPAKPGRSGPPAGHASSSIDWDDGTGNAPSPRFP